MRRFFCPSSVNAQRQRGFPMPLGADETRAFAGRPLRNDVPMQSGPIRVQPGRSDMGARGYVNIFGQVGTNPIGAGVVAMNRPQPFYGPAGEYVENTIFWVSQAIPTSIPQGPLVSPATMAALLGAVNVQAAVRTA